MQRMKLTGIGAGVMLAAAVALPAQAEEVLLKAGTFLPPVDTVWYPPIEKFLERVNERGKPHGLQIKMVAAGFKAMSPFQMGDALKNGVLDLVHLSGTFYNRIVPIADAQKLSTVPVQEQRKNGTFEVLRPIYAERMNAHYLGRWGDGIHFHIYLNKTIDKADLSGLKIRGTSVYKAFVEALGGTMVITPPGEAYTAIERGVVDGYGWPLWGIEAWGWEKITKYRLDPGFYIAEVSVLVNLSTWNKLTKEQQEVLHEAELWLENEEFPRVSEANTATALKLQSDAGIKPITLTGQEAEKFLGTAQEAGWKDVLAKDPELGPKIRELTTQ